MLLLISEKRPANRHDQPGGVKPRLVGIGRMQRCVRVAVSMMQPGSQAARAICHLSQNDFRLRLRPAVVAASAGGPRCGWDAAAAAATICRCQWRALRSLLVRRPQRPSLQIVLAEMNHMPTSLAALRLAIKYARYLSACN